MSWSDAKRDAGAIRPLSQVGRRIYLPHYTDQAALDLFAPYHKWRVAYYRMVLDASTREHKRAGLKITWIKIGMEDYIAWLYGRPDSTELRAGFIASLLAGA